jgi:hypothetical protein
VKAVERVLRSIDLCREEGWRSVDETEWMDAEEAHLEWGELIDEMVAYADRVGFDLTSLLKLPGEELALLMGLKPRYADTRGMPAGSHRRQDDDEWRRLAALAVRDLVEFKSRLGRLARQPASGEPAQVPSGTTPATTEEQTASDECERQNSTIERDVILAHAKAMYSINGCNPILVSDDEDNVLLVFRATPAMNTPVLQERSGVDDPDKVIGRLATKYKKRFAPAIDRPGNRGGGGFYIRIRETPDAKQERLEL